MKLSRFLPSGDGFVSPRQLVHSIELLFHILKRFFVVPIVCDDWVAVDFSNFWSVRPAMVVCCLLLLGDSYPSMFVAYFLRSFSVVATSCRFAYFLCGSNWFFCTLVLQFGCVCFLCCRHQRWWNMEGYGQ